MTQNKHIGNSRFVFFELRDDFSRWQGILGKVDNYIRDNSVFERANPFALIYFLPGDTFWVGREVIGSLPLRGDDDPNLIDFKMGEVYSFALDIREDLKLEELLLLKKKICQENVKGIDGEIYWRLRIDLEKEDKIFSEIQIFAPNYPFPKLTN